MCYVRQPRTCRLEGTHAAHSTHSPGSALSQLAGYGRPVIGVGLLAGMTGLLAVVQSFPCAVAVLCLLALLVRTRVHT